MVLDWMDEMISIDSGAYLWAMMQYYVAALKCINSALYCHTFNGFSSFMNCTICTFIGTQPNILNSDISCAVTWFVSVMQCEAGDWFKIEVNKGIKNASCHFPNFTLGPKMLFSLSVFHMTTIRNTRVYLVNSHTSFRAYSAPLESI